jgi:cytochrome c-type biogenesis protein CcmH
MHRLRNSLLVALVALAQTASLKPSFDVRRVAQRLACLCGCKDSVATCAMIECSFSKPAKERIAKMLSEGMSDQAIIDVFVKEYGLKVYLAEPSAFGWLVPCLSIAAGLGVIWLFLRRFRKPRPRAEDPALAKYRDQIERDTAHLD